MFEQDYNNLYESEKQEFRRIANYLLSKTFVVRDVYDKQSKKMITSSEFLFMEKYYDIFENYLSIAGWKLTKEPIEGIYWVENEYGQNKAKFDSFTTYILLALMITYEESPGGFCIHYGDPVCDSAGGLFQAVPRQAFV